MKDTLTIKITKFKEGYKATFKPITTHAYGRSWPEILMEIYGLIICYHDSLNEDQNHLAENLKAEFEFLQYFLKEKK